MTVSVWLFVSMSALWWWWDRLHPPDPIQGQGNRRWMDTNKHISSPLYYFSQIISNSKSDHFAFTSTLSHLFLRPSGRFLLPTSVAGFMQAKSRKSGWRTSSSMMQNMTTLETIAGNVNKNSNSKNIFSSNDNRTSVGQKKSFAQKVSTLGNVVTVTDDPFSNCCIALKAVMLISYILEVCRFMSFFV